MKTYISTFFKYFVLILIFFCVCSCQQANKEYAVASVSTEEESIVNLSTPQPTPTPEVVDINLHPNDSLNTIIDEFESKFQPTDTPVATDTPEPTKTPKPTKDPNEELMDFIMNMETSVVSTPTPSPTSKPLFASSAKATSTPKVTKTPTPTKTPKVTPKITNTPKPTKTPKVTSTPTPTPKITSTPVPETKSEETAIFNIDSSGNKTSESSVNISGDYDYDDLYLACKVAYLEASSTDGRKAVLNVIYNRCNSSKYGGTVEKEVYRKSQFSVVNNSKFETLEISDSMIDYANDIFNEGKTVLPSDVLYFRAAKYGTEWGNKTYYDTIGGNVFFSS